MNANNTYLKIMLLMIGCLFTLGLYAEEDAMEEEGMLEEEVEELPPLYTSEVEIGVGFSTVDSFKFGEYNGLEDDGAFAIGNITLRKNAIIDDTDNNYWEFSGTNLGLDNRNIFMEYSHDGTYGDYSKNSAYSIYFEYDQIPHNQFEDGMTPYNGAGTTNQTLPAGWGPNPSNNAPIPAASFAFLKNVELETERQRLGGGFKWKPLDNWQVQGSYRHEDKEGSDPFGAIFGSSGGNPKGAVIAIPIDYDFDEFNISLAYTGMKGQASLDYHLSLFDNNDTSVFFDNAFDRTSSWAAGTQFSDGGVGRLGLFPDNQAHQVNLSGGYNFTPKTRATATVSYSWWLQDETFLPYSNIHPTTTPLPRNDLDGEINTLFFNANLFHRVNNKLDLKARYTYDNRDNDTPRDVYVRIAGDAQTQPAPGATSGSRVNWTYDLERHKVELDGNYRITPRTRVSLGYEYESKERNFSEVADTDEHTGKIKLSSNPVDYASGWIKYSHSVRNGSTYVSNQPFLDGHDPAYIATLTGDPLFENDPLLRKFHFADRDRDMLNFAINAYPIETLTFSLSGHYKRDDYDESQLGLQESKNTMLTLDLNYQPNDIINTYAYISSENYQYDQRGYRRTGSPDVGPGFDRSTASASWGFWSTDTEDRIHTFGTGIDWNVVEDKFNLKLDFTYSQAETHYTQAAFGTLTPPIQLPDVDTDWLNLSLTGDYKIKENMTARFKYMYENMQTDDFTLDDVHPDTVTNVILLGNSSPNYDAHVFGLSLIYRF